MRKRLLEVERLINGLSFVAVNELENRNCLDAWLGSIPGNCAHNLRYPIVNTINLAHLFPISAVWAGPTANDHLSEEISKQLGRSYVAVPHLFALTNGSTPFRLSLNVGDVGHTMIIGPTGAGKSVLLNVLEAQFRRYPNAQVYIFDKGGSSRAITLGVGGDFYDLGGENSALSFQPLRLIDNLDERKWAQEWVIDILAAEGLDITPELKSGVWNALCSLATGPIVERTMTGLQILAQDPRIKTALGPYTVDGAHGQLLDSKYDSLAYGRWQAFEMEEIMNTPSVVMPVLSYLFHRLEQRFTGPATLLVLDEAWLFLDHPAFAQKLREWLKVLRKKNVYVVFATQSLADVDASAIVATVKEACMTKIYLPNKNALDPDISAIYKKFGLNDRQLQILAFSQGKRDYYFTSPDGNRVFELGLSDVALAYCAGTGKENQKLIHRLHTAGVDFNYEYLKAHGVDWAVTFIESMSGKAIGQQPQMEATYE